MRIPRLIPSAILLISFTTCIFAYSSAASAEIDPESGAIKMDGGNRRVSFPGECPRVCVSFLHTL